MVVVEVEVERRPPSRYTLAIRDLARLAQDVEAELADRTAFSEPNVVVVRRVDRGTIEAVVRQLADRDFAGLVAEYDGRSFVSQSTSNPIRSPSPDRVDRTPLGCLFRCPAGDMAHPVTERVGARDPGGSVDPRRYPR